MLTLRLIGSAALLDSEQCNVHLSPRGMSVLAYIVLHARPKVSRMAVASAVWPSLSETRAKGNLRRELHGVRSAHPVLSASILPGRNDIEFLCVENLHVDVRVLETINERIANGSCTAAELREIVRTLSTGGPAFLQGIEDEWMSVFRLQFENEFLRITDRLIQALFNEGSISDALSIIDKQLAINSIRETSYLQKMHLLSNSGNRALAIKAYEECEEHFLDELGVKPNVELKKLYAELLLSAESNTRHKSDHLEVNGINVFAASDKSLMIGRQQELSAIHDFLAECNNTSVSGVLIRGISGIGKSHLLRTLVQQIDAPTQALFFVKCHEYEDNLPFAMLTQLIEQLDHTILKKSLSQVYLDEVLSALASSKNAQFKRTPPGQRSRRRFFDSMSRLMRASGGMITIAIDDAQWLDSDSSAWLKFFSATCGPASPLALLLAERATEKANGIGSRLLDDIIECSRVFETILSPLTPNDAYDLFQSQLELRQDRPESTQSKLITSAALYSLTGGRPQLIIELAMHDSILGDETVGDDLTYPLITELANERITKLSSQAQDLINVISVINGLFHWKMLCAISRLDNEAILPLLEELWSSQLLTVSQSGDYELAHPFYRNAVLQKMSPLRKTFYHNRLADFYSEQVGLGHTRSAGLAAVHSLQAGDRVAAFSWFRAAAEHAEQAMAHEDAIVYCEEARALLPQLGGSGALLEEEISVLLLQVRQVSVLEGYASPTVKTLCAQVIDRSKSISGAKLSHDVNKQIRVLYTFGNKPRKARAASLLQIKNAESCGDPFKEIEAWRCKGVSEFQLGQFAECEKSMTKAIGYADTAIAEGSIDASQVPFFVTVACNFRALMQYIQGRPEEGAASLARGQSYKGRHTDIFSRYLLSITTANVHQLLGNTQHVKTLAMQLQQLAAEYHLPKMQCLANYFNGWVTAREGNADTGLRKITAAIENFPKTADHHLFPFWWCYKAELEFENNRAEDAYRSIQKALTASRYTRQGAWVAEQYRLLGLIKRSLYHDESDCQKALSCSLRVAAKQNADLFRDRTLAAQSSHVHAFT